MSMDLASFHAQFRDETAENMRILTDGLLALEQDPADRERLDTIFRAVHTVKGSARLLGFEPIGRVAHVIEHILGAVRAGQREMNRPLADELLRGADAILELTSAAIEGRPAAVDVEQLTRTLGRGRQEFQPGPPPPSPPAPPPEPAATPADAPLAPTRRATTASRQTIRVRVDRLDRLLNLAGELAVSSQVQLAHLQTLTQLQALLVESQRNVRNLASELGRLRFSPSQQRTLDQHLDTLLNTSDRARLLVRSEVEHFGQQAAQSSTLIDDLEQEIMAARLLPLSTALVNLPRAVRELAHACGKQVRLVTTGEHVELDRKVIEALGDPLLHLVRNAIDHGIESPDERVAAGKPAEGVLTIRAEALGAFVNVTINDDGRGIQPQKLRESAVRKGLVSADAAALLNDHEALDLVFMPGFSTAAIITDVSGRGVGMDVVRTNVAEIGGQVQIESAAGTGTTITLMLPLTLITTRVLLVEAGGQTFALPAASCYGTIRIQRRDVRTVEGRAIISHEGRSVPLLQLGELLGLARSSGLRSTRLPAVLAGPAQRPLALLIDNLIDEREAVVKPLGPLLEHNRRYHGAVQLGDGRLVLLLNPSALVQAARGMGVAAPLSAEAERSRPRLLLTDDSFTTRELFRSILSSAGYEVTVAVDGRDALEKLRTLPHELLVTDVEMPGMNGFQLTRAVRQEPGFASLPIVIITSLASDDHRRQGLDAGAQAYIVKGAFDQSNLIETIQQLLGR